MDAQNQENLRELVERFVDAGQSQKYIDDIQAGEQILRDYPAPQPDEMLIASIKAEITLNILPRRKVILFRQILYRTAAVAAAVIIISAIGVGLFDKQSDPGYTTQEPEIAALFPWNENDDLSLKYILVEADKVEQDLAMIETGEDDNNILETMRELESLSESINSDIWEG